MSLQDVSSFIQMIGFPVAVCCWLLYRQEKRLEKLTDTMVQIVQIVTLLQKTIDDTLDSREKTR